jgi:hypothetical protein
MYLHTMAGVCTHRAEHVPAFVALYQGDEHEFAFLAFSVAACICVHKVLHMLPRIKCWACTHVACICMCLHVSKTAYLDALRV